MLNTKYLREKYRLIRFNQTKEYKALKCLVTLMIIFYVVFFCLWAFAAPSKGINVSRLSRAIFLAEGGLNTRYPFGILTRYHHTSPRKACINTIKHRLRDWNGRGDFISFLGLTYCPPNASPLNKNWISNVKKYYYSIDILEK